LTTKKVTKLERRNLVAASFGYRDGWEVGVLLMGTTVKNCQGKYLV